LNIWRKNGGTKMKKLDKNLKLYLSFLILCWVVIVYYMIFHLKINDPTDEQIKKELKTYPYNHSQIKDTINDRK
jgi:hypothetical protein